MAVFASTQNLRSSSWGKNKAVERYSLDPEKISLQRFYRLTKEKKLIPSRVTLQDGIDQYFLSLEKMDIQNLRQLGKALGNRRKLKQFSRDSEIPEHYLILLKREAGSYLSKAFLLSDFPGIPLEYTEVLKTKGIRNTRDYFETIQGHEQRQIWAKQIGIPLSRLEEIQALCDLSRITGVGGIYARIIYHAGIRSVQQFAETDAATHNAIPQKALGDDDLAYCITYARLIVEINSNPKQT